MEEINHLAKHIAKDILLVRVDFYEINDHINIGECIIYCLSGMIQFLIDKVDMELSKK